MAANSHAARRICDSIWSIFVFWWHLIWWRKAREPLGPRLVGGHTADARAGLDAALDAFPDNLMWETDYPHPTCQYPSPNSSAQHPADYAEQALGNVSEETARKVLQHTAARIYNVDL